MASFDEVVDEYDAARPSYPDGVYDALGDLDGLRVLDVGAGTGIATRQLLERGARVTAVDHSPVLLERARSRAAGLPALVADGATLPVRAASVDLVCFAQAWHWLDETARAPEVRRVLRPGGRWAAWWTHARADGEPWFDRCWDAIERWCPGTHRGQRDTDWGATGEGIGPVAGPVVVGWDRQLLVEAWMTDQASHSYVAALPTDRRQLLLEELGAIVAGRFPRGGMTVPCETWLWTATRI